MMRVSASETAQRAAVPLRNAAYEQMLVKLAADNRTLKQIRSKRAQSREKARAAAVLSAVGRWRAGKRQRRRMTS
jgi:hypothetical protein